MFHVIKVPNARDQFATLRLRERTVEMVVKAHCGTVLGDKFAAMLKMRPSKQSHNAVENHLEPVSGATSKWRITSEGVNGAPNARNT